MKYPEAESSTLEFKADIPKHDQIIKTVIGFCNMHGGKIIIGVEDNGDICGIPEDIAHEAMESLNQMIYQACAPPILAQIYLQHIDEKYLLVIAVSAGMQKPYYISSLGLAKGTYLRLGRSTVRANADLIEELKLRARGLSFDQTAVYHAQLEDLDSASVERFLSERRNGAKAKMSVKALESYHIVTEEHSCVHPSVCGILLFGNKPQQFLTEAYVLCSHFSGIKGREAIASQVCNGTLFEQFDAAYDFVVSRLHKSYAIRGKRREETLEIPPIAIREILMNALLHRNYALKSPIKIAIYDNRIEFFSPGVFPGAIDITQLESGITYTRNVALAKVLWESRYVEKMGSGFIEVFDSYRAAGLARPEIIEGSNFVKCILPREKALSADSDPAAMVLCLFQYTGEMTRREILERTGLSKSSLARLLAQLVQQNRLVRVGQGRSSRYRKVS